jgi:hypothetical protein
MPSLATLPIGQTEAPRSSDVSDPLLEPFLSPTFDPTAYLNCQLQSLAIPTQSQPIVPAKSLTLAELTARTQTHIAQLSAQTARLSATLTSLTDDILRSGSRLAYEVELLRGEALSLHDTLAETLASEVTEFVPEGLPQLKPLEDEPHPFRETDGDAISGQQEQTTTTTTEATAADTIAIATEPSAIAQLRTLHHIRSRLQSVITTFDLALSWPLPPTSTFLVSVSSAPSTPSNPNSSSDQQKAQIFAQSLRTEIADLLNANPAQPAEGILAAERRVEQLRDLATVWKGTQEEKVRGRFVDGLEQGVAQRRREGEMRGLVRPKGDGDEARRSLDQQQTAGVSAFVSSSKGLNSAGGNTQGASQGFLSGLKKLRDGVYLD